MAQLFKIPKSPLAYEQTPGNLELGAGKPKSPPKVTGEEFRGLGERYGITPPNLAEESVDKRIQRRIKEISRQIRGLPPIQ